MKKTTKNILKTSAIVGSSVGALYFAIGSFLYYFTLTEQGLETPFIAKIASGKPKEPDEPIDDGSQYADWGAADWEGYFAQIRQSEGKAAAEEELNYFISQGWIPKNMTSYAAIGARGSLGH